MYQLLRITGAISSTLLLFILVRAFFSPIWALTATSLAVLVESGPTFTSFTKNFFNLLPAWDVQILYERRFALPHHTWGDTFGFFFFFLLFSIFFYHSKPLKGLIPYILILGMSGFWATTVLPSFIVPYFALSLPSLIFVIVRNKISWKKWLPILVCSGVGIAIAALLLKIEFSKGSPWTEWTAEEKSWMKHTLVVSQYVQTLLYYSIFIFAAIIGSILRYKKMTTKIWAALIFSLSWILGPIPLIYISHFSWFPFANFRLVDLHGYAPAGVLSAIGIWHIISFFPNAKLKKIIALAILTLFLVISGSTTWQYTKQIFSAQKNFWSNIYPSSLTWQGVLFIEKLPVGSKVMVREFFGEMLPAFGPVSVFIGGGHGFRDWGERQWISQHFYKGLLTDIDAKDLLRKEKITHVFWGPDEKSLLQKNEFYPSLLNPLFVNNDVTVFEVKY